MHLLLILGHVNFSMHYYFYMFNEHEFQCTTNMIKQ